MANFVILTGERTKLAQSVILLCQKCLEEMSSATISCMYILPITACQISQRALIPNFPNIVPPLLALT